MKLPTLPTSPGVYLFKDSRGDVIYVGKAKSLRSRVRSYFGSSRDASPRTTLLVRAIASLETIQVDSEVEALLLENKLIKRHDPKYNVRLKDSKTFAYLKITPERFPRVVRTRRVTSKGEYFGPYVDGYARLQLEQLSVQLFKIRSCRTLPKKACLNYHIGLCTAPCIGKVSASAYAAQVDGVRRLLKGETKEIVRQLKAEMASASASQHYEIALEKKRQIDALMGLDTRQKVDLIKRHDQHVIAFERFAARLFVAVFRINRGVIAGKREYQLDDDAETPQGFLKAYYSSRTVPREVIVSEKLWSDASEKKVLEQYLGRLRGGTVSLSMPQRGEKKGLVALALKNISKGSVRELEQLQKTLILPTYPRVIECFDVSNLGDRGIVAAMTQWIVGAPNKEGYRKFKIKGQTARDDYAAMREAVSRRYKRLRDEGGSMPQLVIIDGGKGQLGAALSALEGLGMHIPIVGLAKREEEIFTPGGEGPLRLRKDSPMMLLVRRMRDSVHRFALGYQKKRREIEMREDAESKD